MLGDGELRATLERLRTSLGYRTARTSRAGGRTSPLPWPTSTSWLLSSRNEGTPVALIEALAASRPVVATDVGGVRHVVQDGETGWLCGAGDAAGLARLLQQVTDQPEVSCTSG